MAKEKEEQKVSNIGNVNKREIVTELKESYIDYAMSVIVAVTCLGHICRPFSKMADSSDAGPIERTCIPLS